VSILIRFRWTYTEGDVWLSLIWRCYLPGCTMLDSEYVMIGQN